MPYQAAVLGKSWPELEPRLQAVILAMLRVVGGGFIGLALAIAWLSFALLEGVLWAPWAILTIAAVMLAPALYSTLALRRVEATAHTPVAPTVVAIAPIAVATIVALLASVFLIAGCFARDCSWRNTLRIDRNMADYAPLIRPTGFSGSCSRSGKDPAMKGY